MASPTLQLAGSMVERPGVFNLVAALVVFAVSALIGFAAGGYFHEKHDLRNLVALIIVLVWSVANLAQVAVPGYQASIYIHGMMGATVGYLFGLETELAAIVAAMNDRLNGGN